MILCGSQRSRVGKKYRVLDQQYYGTFRYFVVSAIDGSGNYQFDLETPNDQYQLLKKGKGEFPTPEPEQPKVQWWEYEQGPEWKAKLRKRVDELMRELHATIPPAERPIVVFKAPGVILPKLRKAKRK